MGKLIKWVFPIKQHYAKITERERRQYIQDHQEERKKRDWKTKRKGLEKRVWMCEVVGAYREIFSDVGDLFLGLLGNPKAPNFRQSFLHFSSFLLAFSVPQSSVKVSLTLRLNQIGRWRRRMPQLISLRLCVVCSVLVTEKQSRDDESYHKHMKYEWQLPICQLTRCCYITKINNKKSINEY